jgi:hypothetical protein
MRRRLWTSLGLRLRFWHLCINIALAGLPR